MNTIKDLKNTTTKPLVIANQVGIIIFVNDSFERVFGWHKDEIEGKPITTIIPKNFHDAHHLGFSRFQSTEKSTILNHPLKLKAVSKDGRIFSAEHTIIALKENNQWLFAATIEPINETD